MQAAEQESPEADVDRLMPVKLPTLASRHSPAIIAPSIVRPERDRAIWRAISRFTRSDHAIAPGFNGRQSWTEIERSR